MSAEKDATVPVFRDFKNATIRVPDNWRCFMGDGEQNHRVSKREFLLSLIDFCYKIKDGRDYYAMLYCGQSVHINVIPENDAWGTATDQKKHDFEMQFPRFPFMVPELAIESMQKCAIAEKKIAELERKVDILLSHVESLLTLTGSREMIAEPLEYPEFYDEPVKDPPAEILPVRNRS